MAVIESVIRITTVTPYLALTGEPWSVFCEDFGENWPCYNDTALYQFSETVTILCYCSLVCLCLWSYTSPQLIIYVVQMTWRKIMAYSIPFYHILYCRCRLRGIIQSFYTSESFLCTLKLTSYFTHTLSCYCVHKNIKFFFFLWSNIIYHATCYATQTLHT